MINRRLTNLAIIAFCVLVLSLKWIVEPGAATRLAQVFPFVADIHELLRPLVFRPYLF